jgi:tetratricopeptide (TPR) repeat protein
MSLQAAGRKQEAVQALEQSLLLTPRDTVLYSVANVYKELGDYPAAILRLEMLLDFSPNNVMGLTALGDVYRLTKDYDKALACLLKAQSLQPEALEIVRALENLQNDRKLGGRAGNSHLKPKVGEK